MDEKNIQRLNARRRKNGEFGRKTVEGALGGTDARPPKPSCFFRTTQAG